MRDAVDAGSADVCICARYGTTPKQWTSRVRGKRRRCPSRRKSDYARRWSQLIHETENSEWIRRRRYAMLHRHCAVWLREPKYKYGGQTSCVSADDNNINPPETMCWNALIILTENRAVERSAITCGASAGSATPLCPDAGGGVMKSA